MKLILALTLLGGSAVNGAPLAIAADPFAWLEVSTSPRVEQWTRQQDELTRKALDARPGRERLRKRLDELMSAGSLEGGVAARPGKVFYLKREGLKDQPVLYERQAGHDLPHPVLDVNRLSSSGMVALDWWQLSQDGRYLAYGLSEKGSEDSVLHVRETASGEDLPDRIERARHASVAWLPDRTGFYFTRYPRPGAVPAGEEFYHRRVYLHILGTDSLRDELVFTPRDKEDWPDVEISDDGRYLLVTVSQGWSKSELYLKDLTSPASAFRAIAAGKDFLYSGQLRGQALYILTNEDAPHFKIVSVDLKRPHKPWKTLVPEGPFIITGFDLTGGYLAVSVLERAASRLRLHALSGKALKELPIPRLGTVKAFDGCEGCKELFILFESFFIPPTLFRYRMDQASMTVVDSIPPPADLSEYMSEQVSYPSKDGTPISMFLVRQKRLRRDRNAPVLLTGYGGFGISMTPSYAPHLLSWLERGGVYALPNLRGGGEYGELWHKAGMLANKQNAFDDFTSAARWLVSQEYTRPQRLAIYGGSNGGLLIGAAVTQAPELFGAAVCGVPLLDMLRYHLFLMARLWIPEYGSVEDPAQAEYLTVYSPYHHIVKGVQYPAMLFLSGETDSRVHPMHARKMAARLQSEGAPGRPILLRYDRDAGHGAGKPLSKRLDELTDRYSFLFWQLGMQ